MSAFRALKIASQQFEEELTRVSHELFAARIEESFEDSVARKLRDLSLYTSKLGLLRAKSQSLTSQIPEQERDEDTTLEAYGEAVVTRIIEQKLVKSAAQANAVKSLLSAPDSSLEPEMADRKKKILAALNEYRMQEASVQHLDMLLKEKEEKLAEKRREWDQELGLLRDVKGQARETEVDTNDEIYHKLNTLVNKLEMMRWLAGRLGLPRQKGYDWLTDPQRKLPLLKMLREPYSIQRFLES